MAGVYADTSNIADVTSIEAADVKAPIDALDTELARRGKTARVYRTTNQTLVSNTFTAISFDAERFDNDTIHDNVTNNSRLTCRTAGKYLIGANLIFAVDATGAREGILRVNGTLLIAGVSAPAVAVINNYVNVNCIYDLAVGDYVELLAFQSTAGNLDVVALSPLSPEFWMGLVA
jgi:hypothetical protein